MDNDKGPSWWDSECEAARSPREPPAPSGWRIKFWVLLPLVLSYLVELIFTIWELDKQVMKKRFIFFDGWIYKNGDVWDGFVSDASFVYGFMETSSRALIFLSVARAMSRGVTLNIFWVCMWLEIIDGFDYWLFYNHKWFDTCIEFNYIKIGIVFLYTWIELATSSPKQQ